MLRYTLNLFLAASLLCSLKGC